MYPLAQIAKIPRNIANITIMPEVRYNSYYNCLVPGKDLVTTIFDTGAIFHISR